MCVTHASSFKKRLTMAEITLNRDCPATLVPSGEETTLLAGTPVIPTQCKEGSITVATNLGLACVAAIHCDALGSDYDKIQNDLQAIETAREVAQSNFRTQPDLQSRTPSKSDGERDHDRIVCPFCDHLHYPGSDTAAEDEWEWEGDVCEHTLFLAVDLPAFSGFEYRSQLFNRLLGLPDSDDADVHVPSPDDPDDALSVGEIIEKLEAEVAGIELRSYDDEGGMACGPIQGGTITFGFVAERTH